MSEGNPNSEQPHTHQSTNVKPKKDSPWEVYIPRDVRGVKQAIPIASFPMIIYFWPTMLTMLICGLVQHFTEASPAAIGWWATGMFAFNLMVIVTDLDQKKFVILMLLIALVGVGTYVAHLKEMTFISGVTNWFATLGPTYATHTLFILFFVYWFFFVLGMMQPRFDYWRLEPNEFVHYIQPWGRDQSIPRQGSTVAREVPDILELILTFGGGTLVIRREGQVVARIEHVPFLGRRMIAIEKMLGVTRVQTIEG